MLAWCVSYSKTLAGATPPSSANNLVFASSEYLPHYGAALPKQGAVIEIVRRAFATQGRQIDVAFMPFARALYDTQHGEYAGVIAIWHTEARAQHFLYSAPIYTNNIVLFKRVGDYETQTSLIDILNSTGTLGLVTGYANNPLLQNSTLNKVSVATDEQIFSMLALQRVDLVPADVQNGLHLIAQLPTSLQQRQLTYISPPIERRPMHLALPKSRPESVQLLAEFNHGLAQLKETGELARIMAELLPASASNLQP